MAQTATAANTVDADTDTDASTREQAGPQVRGVWVAVRRHDQTFSAVLHELAASTQCRWVELDPKRQHGRPVIAGTRLPLSIVLTRLAARQSFEEIVHEFPDVTVEQLRGAVDFAAEVFDQDLGA